MSGDSRSTPTRRALLAGAAALPAAGALAALASPSSGAAGPAAEELDGELLAACEAFERAAARLDYLNAHAPHTPFGDPVTVAYEAAIDRANEALFDVLDDIIERRARSPEGIRAKARATQRTIRECRGISGPEAHEELALSLVADLLGSAAA